ncbi:MAG: hypothetical protein HC936_05405, partial [Leptolyngbyaceae cyanobacterium SU_3_3]|nr:hypothetical protein [Leptolyngbyaceae cyanobacterium SU_3_3]
MSVGSDLVMFGGWRSMPGFLLNVGSTVMCAHGGQAKPTMPVPRVRAMGLPVTVQPPPYVIAGCLNPPPPWGVWG